MSNVVGLNEYKALKQYSSMIHLNLALDTVHRNKTPKREYAKELQVGYMKLLSNKQ